MWKCGQKEGTTKDFYGQRQITDIFTININKGVISDKVPCNNGKDCRYIVGYGLSQYNKNPASTMSLNVSEGKRWMSQYKKIWNEIESQLFEKMVTELIEREGRYVNGNLKTWKERIKTNFHGQDVPYNMHYNATAVLKIDFVYKQGQKYHPQVYVEECKYINAETQQCSMLSDDDDDGFFEV